MGEMLSALSVSQEMSLPASPSSTWLSIMVLSSPGHPETNAGSSKHSREHTEMRNNSLDQLHRKKEKEEASKRAILCLFSCASLGGS